VRNVCTGRSRKTCNSQCEQGWAVWIGQTGIADREIHHTKTSGVGGRTAQGLLRASRDCCQLYLRIKIPSSGVGSAPPLPRARFCTSDYDFPRFCTINGGFRGAWQAIRAVSQAASAE
jgi:hypothetical protein